MIAGMAGDQQASLIGQGCTRPGLAKATFGTGGMLDQCVGTSRPSFRRPGAGRDHSPSSPGQRRGTITWGVEAIMLSAGTCVEWLRDDLGIIDSAADSAAVAARLRRHRATSGSSPRCSGWARRCGTSGPGAPSSASPGAPAGPRLVRAVLEGVAHRGADLLEAAEADSGLPIDSLRVDGGMSANPVFTQALADACGRPIEISPVLEATTLGAAYLAGMAVGIWADEDDVAAAWSPRRVVEPGLADEEQAARRQRWLEARERSEATIPELSALDF